jgi:glycerol-3-phosphate cytidylyltransferase
MSDSRCRDSGAVVGYVPGAYDMFHVGHLNILRRASLACDWLIAGVVSDEVAEIQKGHPPRVGEQSRVLIVSAIKFVDEVHLELTTDKLATWEEVRFDIVFKGDDWLGSEKWTRLEKEFATRGVRVAYLPYTEHVSSSHLRRIVTEDQMSRGHVRRPLESR